MSGFTIGARRTAQLADVVAACASEPAPGPVPWPVLTGLKQLLSASHLMFAGADSATPRIWFAQYVLPDDGFMLASETRAEAKTNPFWHSYWSRGCSYADRTLDFDSVVTASDFEPLPETRSRNRTRDVPWERSMLAFAPRGPGRHLKLTIWRDHGSDFTAVDRLCLALVKPHIVRAYEDSLKASAQPEPIRVSPRQLQVLRMVQDGYTNLQIAHRLDMSEGTVRTHLNHLYSRLGVNSRTAAVRPSSTLGPSGMQTPHANAPEQ